LYHIKGPDQATIAVLLAKNRNNLLIFSLFLLIYAVFLVTLTQAALLMRPADFLQPKPLSA